MYNYDPKEHVITIGFDSVDLFAEAREAVDKVIEKFFGKKAFEAMNCDDYLSLYNNILDSIKR